MINELWGMLPTAVLVLFHYGVLHQSFYLSTMAFLRPFDNLKPIFSLAEKLEKNVSFDAA